MKRILLLSLLALSLGLANGWADSIYPLDPNMVDPATLQMGTGAGTACATGGCGSLSGEVNFFDTSLSIYQNQGGAPALSSPVLLILGVPNDGSGGSALGSGSISSVSLYPNYPSDPSQTGIGWTFGTGAYNLNGSGYQGQLLTGDEIYTYLGLSGDHSNSFSNWASAEYARNGITPENFGIYVFALNTNSLANKDLLNIVFSNTLPSGTFAVAWGTDGNGTYYSTPFTNAGLTDPPSVPEPATLSLMLGGVLALMGLALARRRFFHN